MFSSDRFALLNRITWAQAQMRKGNKKEGAEALAGALTSIAMEPALRLGYWASITYLMAAMFSDDDDRKKAERIKKANEVWHANLLRSITGVSPILGTAIETTASMFSDVFYGDSFMGMPIGDAATEMARAGGRVQKEIMKMSDEEAEASTTVIISNTAKFLNQLASLTIGNPFHPIANKVLRGWVGNANDAATDIRALDRYYDEL